MRVRLTEGAFPHHDAKGPAAGDECAPTEGLLPFVDRHNASPKTFIWTARGNDVVANVTRAGGLSTMVYQADPVDVRDYYALIFRELCKRPARQTTRERAGYVIG
jgi:hypothetical protein